MSVVKKTEFNAEGVSFVKMYFFLNLENFIFQRARQGERKIKTKKTYDGVSPGKLHFSVGFS